MKKEQKLILVFFLVIFTIDLCIPLNNVSATFVYSTNVNEGTLLDSFDSNVGWHTVSGSGANKTDYVFKTEGIGSLMMWSNVALQNDYIFKYIHYNINWRSRLGIDIYCENRSNINNIYIFFSSVNNSVWTKSLYFHVSDYVTTGWNRLIFNCTRFTSQGGDNFNSTMVRMKIGFSCIHDYGVVYFDNLRLNYSGTPTVILTMDDDFNTTDSYAMPVLRYYGLKGVRFVTNNSLGKGGMVPVSTLEYEYNVLGWDICSHTFNHSKLPELSYENMRKAIWLGYNWVLNEGFDRDIHFFAYPGGLFDEEVVRIVDDYFTFCRTVVSSRCERHFDASDFATENDRCSRLYHFKGSCPAGATPRSEVESWINESVHQGSLLVLVFHQFTTTPGTPPTSEWNLTDFNLTCKYLYDLQNSGVLRVVSLSEYNNAVCDYNPVYPSSESYSSDTGLSDLSTLTVGIIGAVVLFAVIFYVIRAKT